MDWHTLVVAVSFGLNAIRWYWAMLLAMMLITPLIRTVRANGSQSEATVRNLESFIRKRCIMSSMTDNDKPTGFVVGFWFFALVSRASAGARSATSIYILLPRGTVVGQASTLDEIGSKTRNAGPNEQMDIWQRSGPIWSLSFNKSQIPFPKHPTSEQKHAIESVVSLAEKSFKNGFGFNASAFVHGESGTGKSELAYFLARTVSTLR